MLEFGLVFCSTIRVAGFLNLGFFGMSLAVAIRALYISSHVEVLIFKMKANSRTLSIVWQKKLKIKAALRFSNKDTFTSVSVPFCGGSRWMIHKCFTN